MLMFRFLLLGYNTYFFVESLFGVTKLVPLYLKMKKLFLETFFDNISYSSTSSSSRSSSSDSSFLDVDSDTDLNLRKKHVKNENYFELIIPNYSEADYKKQFRMSRNSVLKLCDLLNLEKKYVGGWPEISKSKTVHITLHYLANKNSFREVADKFNITESACHKSVLMVTEALKHISKNYIKLPQREQFHNISMTFARQGGLPYTIGVIDGTHLEIPRPKNHQEDYFNRKGYHSIILQGVVDENKIFNDIYIGEPGSLHDARVLKKSPLYEKLETTQQILPYYFLADSAYPPSVSWLVPPFKDNGNLTENQKEFNQRLSKKRIVVEQAFGLLKGRFRRVTRFDNRNIDIVINCAVGAVVLHNLCIMWDDLDEEFLVENELPRNDIEDYIGPQDVAINTRRDEIFQILYNN